MRREHDRRFPGQSGAELMTVRRDERGATAVEFAIILPLVILFVGLLLFGGFYALYASTADHAASEAARYASIRQGNSNSAPYPTAAEIAERVNGDVLPGFVPDAEVSLTTLSEVPNEGDRVTVTIRLVDLPVLNVASKFLSAVGLTGFDDITRTASERRQ